MARYRDTLAAVASAYARAGDEGTLRPGTDPAQAARQLVALMDGLQIQWLLDGGVTDMAAVVRAHIQAQVTVPL